MPKPPQGEVLFVTSSYPRWRDDATAPFIHHLAQDLRSIGWNVRVLAPHAPGAARDEVLDGVPVRRFRYLWPESLETVCYDGGALVKLRANRWLLLRVPFLVVAQWLAVTLQLLRHRATLVHAHWLLPQGLTAGLAAAMFGCRCLATVHGSDIFALRGAVSRVFKRVAIRLADVVTVNSGATLAAVAALAPGAGAVVRIPMGAASPQAAAMDATRTRTRAGAGPTLIFVGRLIPEKGVADLIGAVQELRQTLPSVTALIVGDGPSRGEFEQLAHDLGVAESIRFLGWLPQQDVPRMLRDADIFVAPSCPGVDGTQEAQGLAIAEAMLAGIPVVATVVGGIPDAIRHEETGLLVEPSSPAEVADAVRRLATDRALGDRLAGAARALAESEFTREVCARRFSEIYGRLVSANLQSSAREKT